MFALANRAEYRLSTIAVESVTVEIRKFFDVFVPLNELGRYESCMTNAIGKAFKSWGSYCVHNRIIFTARSFRKIHSNYIHS